MIQNSNDHKMKALMSRIIFMIRTARLLSCEMKNVHQYFVFLRAMLYNSRKLFSRYNFFEIKKRHCKTLNH